MGLFNRVQDSGVTRRAFSYRIGKVVLNFNLRTDATDELTKFKVLLERALEDVEEEITKQHEH